MTLTLYLSPQYVVSELCIPRIQMNMVQNGDSQFQLNYWIRNQAGSEAQKYYWFCSLLFKDSG